MAGQPKIFGLGLAKTGTSSLHVALELLGFTSCHFLHDGERGPGLINRAIGEGQPALTHLSGYDAYLDMELYNHLDVLDREHPGSRYIHTVRDVDSWVNSVRAHNQRRASRVGELRPTDDRAEADWRRERERIDAMIERYFARRRDDLLIMDIVGGDGWDKLCPFLGVPVPEVEFPHRNRRPAPPPRRGPLARVRNRLRRTVVRSTHS